MEVKKNFTLIVTILAVYLALSVAASKIKKKRSTLWRHFKDNPVLDQKALFGPRADFDEITKMPKGKKRSRLVTLARSHDTNEDDILEIEELQAWIMEAYRIMDHDEADDKFLESDTNKDSKVTLDEAIFNMHYDVTQVIDSTKSREELLESRKKLIEKDEYLKSRIEEDKKKYVVADRNGDGVLNRAEFQFFNKPFDHPFMVKVEMDIAMESSDDNGDGVLTLDEFVENAEHLSEYEMQQVKERFVEVDTNKDNKVSREELQVVLLPSNSKNALEEAHKVIEEADKNKDGMISILEIVEKEEHFLDHVVTNYGYHLHFVRDEL